MLAVINIISYIFSLNNLGYNIVKFANYNLYFFNDNISLLCLTLTSIIIPICLLAALWNINIKTETYKELSIYILLIELFLFIIFTSTDLLIFFVSFESLLLPIVLIIMLYGSRLRRIKASFYLIFYTLFGSIFFMIGLLFLYIEFGTTNYYNLVVTTNFLSNNVGFNIIIWICLLIPFLIKIPIMPLHIWLVEAHVEAPTVGSVILASLLLKIGTYGIIRFILTLFTTISLSFQLILFTVCIISVVLSSLFALIQIDIKKLIAYSSIAHMNICLIGLFSFNQVGLLGSLILMISHGFISAGLFLLVGFLYDKYKSRNLFYYTGLTTVMPLFTILFGFFIFSNMSFPGTSSFFGEILILMSIYKINIYMFILILFSIFLNGLYPLLLFSKLSFGTLSNYIKSYDDINRREFVYFSVLIFFILLIGFYPQIIINKVSFLLLANY